MVGVRHRSRVRGSVFRTASAACCALLVLLTLPGIARAEPGDLDPSFRTGGFTQKDFGGFDQALALDVGPDAEIVAVGATGATVAGDWLVVRHAPDGGLDPGFGTGGFVTRDFFGGNDQALAVAIQPGDGRILVAGAIEGPLGDHDFGLVRYRADGSLDPDFGFGGIAKRDFGGIDVATAVAVQPDGKIVVAGFSDAALRGSDFVLLRYDADGSPDASFDASLTDLRGVPELTPGGSNDIPRALAIRADGRILAAGESDAAGTRDFALVRYEADGTLDSSFGRGGVQTTDFGGEDSAQDLVLRSGGRILLAGSSDAGGSFDFALAGYTPKGRADPDFGERGALLTDFGVGSEDAATAVVVQHTGAILVAGRSDAAGTTDFGLARYCEGGELDARFGMGGRVTTGFLAGASDRATAARLQAGGNVVVGGVTILDGHADYLVARYLASEPPDCSGAETTMTTLRVPGDHPSIQAAVDAAADGDTILVSAGTYAEQVIIRERTGLILKAKGAAVIDGGASGTPLTIRSSTDVTVTGFTLEAQLGAALLSQLNQDLTLSRLTIPSHAGPGILDLLSRGLAVESSSVASTGGDCIQLYRSQDSVVSRNELGGCGGAAVEVSIGDRNDISRNAIHGTHEEAIGLRVSSSQNSITGNTIEDVVENGILIDVDSSRNVVGENELSGVGESGIVLDGDSNLVTRNRVSAPREHGIVIESTGSGNRLERNRVEGAGHDGFAVEGSANSLIRNRATGSGGFDLSDGSPPGANSYERNTLGSVFPPGG